MERLVTQAEGNAFYLEELIRAVAEGKDRSDALPETVLAMVETRLARLPLEARRVLRAASVFGEVCWEAGVAALLGDAMAPAAASDWLTRLIEQEVLAARSHNHPGEREIAFRHALLREGAYAMLTDDDRRLGHRLAGAWLEQRGEPDPMVLAAHFARGGEPVRAARYYLRAADQAISMLDIAAALSRADLGLACAPTPELRIALLGVRCEAGAMNMQLTEAALQETEELLRAAPPGSIPWSQAFVAHIQGQMLTGRVADAIATISLLHQIEPAPDAVAKVVLSFVAGIVMLDTLGQVKAANALEERCTSIVHATGDREPLARLWWHVGLGVRASFAHEDPWSWLAHGDAIRAIYDVTGGEQIYLAMQLSRGLNLWYVGALAEAEQILAGIATTDAAAGVGGSWRRLGLAWVRADRGAPDEARATAAELAEAGRAHSNPLEESRGHWVLGEVLRRRGDLAGAERALDAALGLTVPLERPGVLASLAQLRLAQGRPGDALVAAEDALARWRAMGGCGFFRGAFVHLALAEAEAATGARDAAHRTIANARARLLTISARIADPALQRSFLDDVPENARILTLAHAWLGEHS
jgi:eukaryotic-like serine/threonine-protein kinase